MKRLGLFVAVLLTSFLHVAHAGVLDVCKQAKTNREHHVRCALYLRGYLDGALVTDTAIITHLKNKSNISDYMRRVYETRAPSRNSRDEATLFAQFCLPAKQTTTTLAEQLITKIPWEQYNDHSIAQVVYNALKVHYPCRS